jgi:hypothetical protein
VKLTDLRGVYVVTQRCEIYASRVVGEGSEPQLTLSPGDRIELATRRGNEVVATRPIGTPRLPSDADMVTLFPSDIGALSMKVRRAEEVEQ